MKDKRIVFVIIVVILVFIVAGIIIFSHKRVVCTNKTNQSSNGYVLETKYVIKTKFNKVKTINIIETITSKDKKVLKKFDMYRFIDNNEAMKKYTKNNKLTLDGAKKMYESTGATCK